MENKITIAIVALMVAALVAPGVMAAESVGYSANVVTSDVSVALNNGNFGNLLAGGNIVLSESLTLTNSGGAPADVSAKFTTDASGTYGLIGLTISNVIPAASVKIDGQTMSNLGDPVPLSQVPAHDGTNDGTVNYDAELTVPSSQAVDEYSGDVLLTFEAV